MKKTVSLIMMFVIALTAFTGCQKSRDSNGDGRQKFSQMIIGQEDLFSTVISVTAYRDSQDEFDGMIDLITKKYTYLNDLYDIYNDYDGVNNVYCVLVGFRFCQIQFLGFLTLCLKQNLV